MANSKQSKQIFGLAALASLSDDSEKTIERKNKQLALDNEKAKRLKRAQAIGHPSQYTQINTDGKLRLDRIREQHEKMARDGVKKHASKAAGVKSVFYLNKSELFMTSFGKGNKAEPEKHILNDVIKTIPADPAYTVEAAKSCYNIKGRIGINAVVDNPLTSTKAPGTDLIGLKDKLEMRYFGRTFEDNIHIQLAYSIMDIEKILAVHINNIIYELNNMLRADDTEYFDVIGTLRTDITWEDFNIKDSTQKTLILKLLEQQQLMYFGTILYDPIAVQDYRKAARNHKILSEKKTSNALEAKKVRIETDKARINKEIAEKAINAKHKQAYELLTLLSMIRQSLAHDNTYLYTFDEEFDPIAKKLNHRVDPRQLVAARGALKELYADKISSLNSGFINNSKFDINMLCSIYNAILDTEKKPIIEDYYRFVVTKTYKNQGFSFTRLRENMILHTSASAIMDTRYDSMRGRLYRTFDFVLFRYYKEHPEESGRLVEKLRGAMSDGEKESIYEAEAQTVWKAINCIIIDEVLPWMTPEEIKTIKDPNLDIGVSPDMIKDVALKADNTSAFSMLMFLMSCFLDGKEINDLFTTLINKFDNITSFRNVITDRGIKISLSDGYRMFGKSDVISEELRGINSIMRMDMKSAPGAKRILYIEAAKVIGYPGTDEELMEYADSFLSKDGELAKRGKDFRNFIASNIIESDRFKYLVRYGNVEKISILAKNRAVVDFVLRDIPDTQILRYYNSCTVANEKTFRPDMRGHLAQILTGLSFTDFANVHTNERTITAKEKADKAKKQAVISLYLTILYLIVKNMVYVNSRYFMAFHCLERDANTADAGRYASLFDGRGGDLRAFAKDAVINEEGNRPCSVTINKRARGYVTANYACSDEWTVRAFRNCTEHLGAVRNISNYIGDIKHFDSWFELYHYTVQRYLIDQYKHDSTTLSKRAGHENEYIISPEQLTGKTLAYFGMVEKYHTYCKDLVKAVNIPFAYNLPRYKNLSINELFDRNHFLEKGKEDGSSERLAEEDK